MPRYPLIWTVLFASLVPLSTASAGPDNTNAQSNRLAQAAIIGPATNSNAKRRPRTFVQIQRPSRVSRRIPAGLQDITVNCEPYHFYAGRIDDKNYELWELKVDIALPMIAGALGGHQEAAMFKQEFMDYLLRDDTLTYSNVFTVVGKKY